MKRFLLIALGLVAAVAATAQPDINTRNYAFSPMQQVSPVIEKDSITFKVYAPEAKQVFIVGSWTNFYSEQLMDKGADGIWTYKLAMLPPDIYQYVYDIDGMVVLDPGNYSQTRDMYNYRSNLIIRGPEDDPYFSQSSTRHGTLEKVWYESESFKGQRRMSVYLPYGYNKARKHAYPVLYLIHGGGGDEEAWPSLGRICEIMDYMIEKGLCKPMVVVMPNLNSYEYAACETALPDKYIFNLRDPEFAKGDKFANDLRHSIIPFIESNYKVKAGKNSRAVAGLSMGGFMTTKLAYESPELFAHWGVFSAGGMGVSVRDAVKSVKNAGYKSFMVFCGPNDIAYRGALEMVEALKAEEMEFEFLNNVESGHTWQTWRVSIQHYAPTLF